MGKVVFKIIRNVRRRRFLLSTLGCILLIFLIYQNCGQSGGGGVSSQGISSGPPITSNGCTLGTSWSTSNVFSGTSGSASGNAIAIDSTGVILAVGEDQVSSGASAQIIRKSTDGGQTWSTALRYPSGTPNGQNVLTDIAIDSADRIFAVGYISGWIGSIYYINWSVWLSTNHGVSWSSVDPNNGSNTYQAVSIAVDVNDNVYVVGTNTITTGYHSVVIRKSTDHGISWSTLGAPYYKSTANGSIPRSIYANKINGDLLISGSFFDSSGTSFFTSRYSDNGGTSWNNIDEFRLSGGSNFGNETHALSLSGSEMLAFGTSDDSTGQKIIVRKTSDRGANWQTVFNQAANSGRLYKSILGADGFVYSVGYDNNGWKVRKSTADFSVSSEIDSFNYNSGAGGAVAYGIAQDAAKNLWVVGQSGGSPQPLIIRKLSCQ